MALGSYQGLIDSIPAWLHRSGDPSIMEIAPDLVSLAETTIYTTLRVREMEESFESTIASGTIPVPAGYVGLKHVYLNTTPAQNLTRKSVDWILSRFPLRSSDGCPEHIARDNTVFIFGPYPDSDYVVKGVYYKRPAPLSETGTGPLLTKYPNMFLFGALLAAEAFIRNDPAIQSMLQVWAQAFGRAVNEAQGEEDLEKASGGRARVNVVGVTP